MAIENLDFRINAAIDAGNSAKTLGDLRESLKDLRNLAAEVGPDNVDAFNKITLAAGNTNDKIKDVRESISALSGTPMERLTNSFGRLRQSIFELDFDKFKQSLIGIKDSMLDLGKMALSPFKNLGVAIAGLVTGTTSLTAAMRALGGAIAATGIGLLVVSVGLLVTYFNDLKTAGGLIGDTFTAVSTTINSALSALKSFAQTLGLIGPSVGGITGGGAGGAGERQMTPKDEELYKREKAIYDEKVKRIEFLRKQSKEQIDDEIRLAKASISNKQDLAKKEEELIDRRLVNEKKLAGDLLQVNQDWLRKSARYNVLSLGIGPEAKQLADLKAERDRLEKSLARTGLESRGVYKERYAQVTQEIAQVDKEIAVVERRVDNLVDVYSKAAVKVSAGENAPGKLIYKGNELALKDAVAMADNITKDAAEKVRDTRQEITKLTKEQQIEESQRQMNQTQAAKEEQRRRGEIAAENRRKRGEELQREANERAKADVAATEQLEKNNQRQLDIEIEFYKSEDEIDMMYEEIAQDRRFKTSEAIYNEIQRRLQWEQDAALKRYEIDKELNDKMAANKANQFDTENLLISRSQDVFKDYGDFRAKVDEDYAYIAASHADWTSEQIYAEIQRRLYAQIEAYDAEKQAALDKTNTIIATAQYGAQALDGFNQLLYTLDENRRISGEMSEKDMAQRAFKRNKAFGIVNAAINTAAGVTAVLASPTNKIDPTGTLQAIQIGFVIATGLAQIAAIASQKFDANSYNTSTTTPPSVGAGGEATVNTGQFLNVGEFKAGDPRERRVYVVESDITGVQRRIQVIQSRSKF